MAIINQLPTEMQYSQFEKNNPFSMYCSYIDLVRPMDLQQAEKENKDLAEMDELRFKTMQ